MYSRPSIAIPTFVDDEGTPIPYGDRWSFDEDPPDDSYSREHHPERFAPLHIVANALIDHIVATHDVVLTDLGPESDYVNATVRQTRVASRSAPEDALDFLLTDFPSAGVRVAPDVTVHYPVCSCDACDETWEYGADQLEAIVLQRVAFWPARWSGPTAT
ncbi:DUF6226 family protein [Tsukamurella paurometabola]|uniref:Uncharacterized protein n=1 Tax=Tsukamurella paurometabola TaxID=2061 RepID=A0ABS5N856_TSUPA|nr:DUF6226 family protein [Tsukamurella paurometabola]MBS4100451.1 hypothetical protein [Tsukamurella paurometabola]